MPKIKVKKLPRIRYEIGDIPGLEGAPRQNAHNADRPLCAAVAAYASLLRGNRVRGEDDDWDLISLERLIEEYFDVPPGRLHGWCNSINCEDGWYTKLRQTEIMGIPLDAYQIDGIENLTKAGGLVAFGTGLGKTLLALADAYEQKAFNRLYILCPLNAIGTWKEYEPQLKEDFDEVEIISIDSAHNVTAIPSSGGFVIFDEIHKLGGAKAKTRGSEKRASRLTRSAACHAIRSRFDCGIGLTGTLLHSGIERALGMLDLAIPGASAFSDRYAAGRYFECLHHENIPLPPGKDGKPKSRDVLKFTKPVEEALENFSLFMSHYTVSLKKDSPSVQACINIPEQIVENVIITPEAWCKPDVLVASAAMDIYHELKKTDPENAKIPHASKVLHYLNKADINKKLAWFAAQRNDGCEDVPAVLGAQYTDTVESIEAFLDGLNVTYGTISGKTPAAERRITEKAFQDGEIQYIVCQVQAASVSLNLQRAWLSILFDCNYNPNDFDQFMGRTNRRGSTETCYHYNLVCNFVQKRVFEVVQSGQAFDSHLAEWQEVKRILDATALSSIP